MCIGGTSYGRLNNGISCFAILHIHWHFSTLQDARRVLQEGIQEACLTVDRLESLARVTTR